MNIVHTIDKDTVDEQIELKCRTYLKRRDATLETAKTLNIKYLQTPNIFVRKPDTSEEVIDIYNKWITTEKEYYSSVRVIENDRKFILVYGDVDNETVTNGTGPFESLEEAITWFTNGGR